MAFTNLSGDPAQEYFSDGLSDDLIGALGRIADMRVVGRTSTFFYKNKAASIEEIGRRLNVAAVMEGSVRRQGDTLHITAKLIDVVTGYQIWSHSYDRDQGQWLQTQADIAAATASALHVMLRPGDVAQLSLGGTASPRALDAYLRGEKLLRLASDGAGYRAALAAFDEAVQQDPAFALAHSKRARAINDVAATDMPDGVDAMSKADADALAAADRAISLAPSLGEAHASRGWVLFSGFLDIGGAVAEWETAHALAPGDADVESSYSAAETELGHKDKAVEAARRAVELDPLLPWAWTGLASALTAERRYDAAIDTLRYAREVVGGSDANQARQLGRIALLKGDAGTALRECSTGSGNGNTECLAMVYHALGRQQEAAAELDKLRRAIGDAGAYNYAQIYAFWGQSADALNWLEIAVRLRDAGLSQLRTDQLLDSIRDTPEFKEIERKLNFPP
jgi:serine/threonine-protein kinase